ncbi:hypothetical protein BKA80DRAFT_269123 [Phyllosticta citrichinensis]
MRFLNNIVGQGSQRTVVSAVVSRMCRPSGQEMEHPHPSRQKSDHSEMATRMAYSLLMRPDPS